MEYLKFKHELKEGLEKAMPNFKFDFSYVGKPNGGSYDAIVAKDDGCKTGVPVNIEMLFEETDGEIQMQKIVEKCVKHILECTANAPWPFEIKVDSFNDVEDKLFVQLIPIAGNETYLEDKPHIEIQDMAAIVRVKVSETKKGVASIAVNNELLGIWGMTDQELVRKAAESESRTNPLHIKSMEETIAEIIGIKPDIDGMDSGLFVMKNKSGFMGAAAILYPGAMDKAEEVMGGSFFMIPSSQHEFLLLSDKEVSADEIHSIIKDVNRTKVTSEDFLSNSLYYYDSGIKAITRVR